MCFTLKHIYYMYLRIIISCIHSRLKNLDSRVVAYREILYASTQTCLEWQLVELIPNFLTFTALKATAH